ncbi:NeuD/PglB/VioB family sugar acetyltransferase [Kineococcus arenarius]|uniref:NeuD/PglB/VioB family sugar acetyltransferase n=1 Tax=unclassified Kineococcus TaxID=2621656 RepID=UPI003D7CBA79
MERILVIGAGGHAREVLDVVEALGPARVHVVAEGLPESDGVSVYGYDVLGGLEALAAHAGWGYVVAIGDGAARSRLARAAEAAGCLPLTLVHPSASVARRARLGPGSVLLHGARVTSDACLGEHVHVNLNATVAHDCSVGSFSTISPGAHLSGGVRTGQRAWVGSGAVVRERVALGDDVVVGAGAVVLGNVPDRTVVVGIPAHPLAR